MGYDGGMRANGQYDDRLTREDCRAIRRTMRRMQGINPSVKSATLLDNGTAEVITGGKGDYTWWLLRRTADGWEIAGKLRSEYRMARISN